MNNRFAALVILLTGFFITPEKATAWGLLGHRITGRIAEYYLTPKAKSAIHAILGNESLAMAGNWADFIKADSSFNYLNAWHYINLKDSLTRTGLQVYLNKDTAADAYTKLSFLMQALQQKNASAGDKKMYLRLLIHIAEDLHQPMHVSREEDQGGNKIKVLWFNEPANLHSVWDEKLISYQQLSYTEYAAAINYATKTQVATWQRQPVSRWLFDSYTIAQRLYSEITAPDQKLSYRYNFDHVAVLNEQLLKGGIQLAGLLNKIFR